MFGAPSAVHKHRGLPCDWRCIHARRPALHWYTGAWPVWVVNAHDELVEPVGDEPLLWIGWGAFELEILKAWGERDEVLRY